MLGLSITVFGQSKKKQIEMLTASKDSIQSLLDNEREAHTPSKTTLTNQIAELNNQINNLNSKSETQNAHIANLESHLKKLETQLQIKEQEIFTQKNTIDNLQSELKKIKDLIKNTIQTIDTLVWEIPDNLTWDQLEFNLKLLLPISKFNVPKGNSLISKDKKILISYDYNFAHWSDEDDGNLLFYEEQDAINYYSRGIEDIEITENKGFIIKGKNASNQLILIKGIYGDMVSMQGRDEGDPTWLWSNTLIVKITADQADKEEFNYISGLIINNFSTESIVYKY